MTIPFTAVQTQDAMFINDNTIATLEYVFYQTDGNTQLLTTDKPDDYVDYLGTEKWHIKPSSAFKNKAINLVNEEKEYTTSNKTLIPTEDRKSKAEAILSLHRTDLSANSVKVNQVSFSYKGFFQQSLNGRMNMMLSHDRKIITLPI